jgi:hypothetical protein
MLDVQQAMQQGMQGSAVTMTSEQGNGDQYGFKR